MRILSCGGLFLFCVYMSPETCSARVYSPNRPIGLWRDNEDDKIVTTLTSTTPVAAADKKFGEGFIKSKFLDTIITDLQSGEKILQRKPRCYDNLEKYNDPEPAVTVKYLAPKLPPWAGTLYHHRILHPYHDWSNTGIPDDLWNRLTRV